MKFIISEHKYIYDLHIRDCCMYVLGYIVLSWCNVSSTAVLNVMYLLTLLFAHSNIFRDFSAIIFDPVYTILAKS